MKKHFWVWIVILIFMSSFAVAQQYDAGVQGRVIIATDKTSGGHPIKYPKSDKGKVTAMEVVIAPGAETGWHKHPVPVYAYVLAGELSVLMEDGQQLQFKQGDAIIEVVDVQHNGINKGKAPVRLIVFYTGVVDVPNVIRSDKP
mgnify:CR=1 FL=1